MRPMMTVHLSGYYAWRTAPVSAREKVDHCLAGLIIKALPGERDVYGYGKVTDDQRCVAES